MASPQTRKRESNVAGPVSAGRKYIYAVVDYRVDKDFVFSGINDRPIYAIACDDIAFLVSDLEADKIRPERRHLAAHRAVLARLIEREGGILPMRFGAIASSPREILRMLGRGHDAFAQQLRRVAGKIEMGLRASWDVPNIFEYLVSTHAELREMRDEVFQSASGASQEARIELGRVFERILNEDRQKHTHLVEDAMAPRCSEIRRSPVREERAIMNLACLVEKSRRREFEDGVFKAAGLFDNNFAFDYNGPWAPHAFAEINLED